MQVVPRSRSVDLLRNLDFTLEECKLGAVQIGKAELEMAETGDGEMVEEEGVRNQ